VSSSSSGKKTQNKTKSKCCRCEKINDNDIRQESDGWRGGRPNGVGVETAQGRELRHASAKTRKRISVFVLKKRERESLKEFRV
jgi:hypothetical protein